MEWFKREYFFTFHLYDEIFYGKLTYVHQRLKNKKHQIILISEAKYPVSFSPRLLCKAKVQHIDNCQLAMCNKVKLVKKLEKKQRLAGILVQS